MSKINGLELPFGIKPVEATPVDAWFGPYSTVNDALASIPVPIRYLTMQVGITGGTNGSKIYWFKNGTNDSDLTPMIDGELLNLVTGETKERINEDIRLHNQITGETKNRIESNDLLLSKINEINQEIEYNYKQLTGETKNRIDSDDVINNKIALLNEQLTGLTVEYEKTINLFNLEVSARNIADIELHNRINDSNNKIISIEDELVNVYDTISGSSGYFNDMFTGETQERIISDQLLDNKINNVSNNLTLTNEQIILNYNHFSNLINSEKNERIESDIALTQTDENLLNRINQININLNDLSVITDNNYEYSQELINSEILNRINSDNLLQNKITGETESRINEDISLHNLITGETKNRQDADVNLYNQITGETKNRENADLNFGIRLGELEASLGVVSGDTTLYNLITGETNNRIIGDIALDERLNVLTNDLVDTNTNITNLTNTVNENYVISNNQLTGETKNRQDADVNLYNQITGLTNVVSQNKKDLVNQITGETQARQYVDSQLNVRINEIESSLGIVSGDTTLYNLITGETKNRQDDKILLNNLIINESNARISGDTQLFNQITGLSETLTNNLMTNFSSHTGDTNVHLTAPQNELLDGITGVTYNEINYLKGLTGNTQEQLNNKSNLNHYHNSLYDQSGTTEILYIDAGKNIHITGDLLVSGTTYETHAETLYIKDNYIYLRDGATAGLANGSYTGIEAVKYNGVNNGRLVFDYLGVARVGDVGNEQPLLTRNEIDQMTDGHLTVWDVTNHRVNTIDPLSLPISNDTNIKLNKEIDDRISGDTQLFNLITGETSNRISNFTSLNNSIINETNTRISGDTQLFNQITGLNQTIVNDYDYFNELINSETQNRISGQTSLLNEINTEILNRINSDNLLQNKITGETESRINEDISLHNLITGETKNRQDDITVLTTEINDVSSIINLHTGNTNIHLTTSQNELLDGITGVTYSEINYLKGLTGNTQEQLNNKSNLEHKHNELYKPNSNSKIIYVDSLGDVHIDGDIYQTGSTYSTHTEQILSKNDYIILRDNATSGLGQNEYAGIEAIKYDGVNNGRLVFDYTGTARVGDVGNEQPLATRDEHLQMNDNAFVYWSNDEQKFKTSNYLVNQISNTFVNSTGDTMTGSLTATSFIKQNGTQSEFLKADGTVDNNVYEVQLPITPENPKNKFLNGERKWAEILSGGKGYVTNFYLSDEDSDIIGYKKITTKYNTNEILKTVTVRNDLGEVLSDVYLFDEQIGSNYISEGVWVNTIGGMINSSLNNTKIKFEYFIRQNNGTEIILFTGYSENFENTTNIERMYSETKIQTILVNPTDRIGVKIYGVTDATTIRTITYCVGGINSSYFNTPMFIKHTELIGLNDDNNYLHLTLDEKNSLVYTGRTINAGDGLIGGGNLSNDILISHGDTSNVNNLTAMANHNGIVIQNLEIEYDKYGHTTGHTIYNLDLDSRYHTKYDANELFVNSTGDTINGDLKVNDINVTTITYRSGETINSDKPGVRKLNTTIGTTEYNLVGHDITLQDGFEVFGWGYNDTDNIIPNGCPLTTIGNNNGITDAVSVVPAIASDDNNTLFRVIGVTTEQILPHSYGIFNIIGKIHDLNLSQFDNGDNVFLSQTEHGKLVKKDSLQINGRITEIGHVIDNSSTNGVLFVKIKNEFGVSNNTQLELENFSANNTSTGAFYSQGITINSETGTTFNVGMIKGWIVDNETNPNKPKIKYVEFSGETNIQTPYLNSNTITYIMLKNDGTLFLSPTFPTPIERREMIFIGNVGHANRISISSAINNIDISISPFSQIRDFLSTIPVINEGIKISPNGSNLHINCSSGKLYSFGINFHNDNKNPTCLHIGSSSDSLFAYRTQTGGTSNVTQNVDTSNYDLNGVITTLSNNTYTNQRVYILKNGSLIIQYGQKIYYTLEDAVNGITTESFVTFQGLKDDGILIGIITLKSNITTLVDPLSARFTQVSRFGEVAGSVGGTSVTTLQSTYDNSQNPEIKTNSTLGALTIRQGSGNDLNNVLEIENGLGRLTALINGQGSITGKTFVVSGGTASQFLKANGSLDSNVYLTATNSGHTHEDLYYNKTISDSRFVNSTGDTISGDFRITGATPINSNTVLIKDINNSAILSGINTGDQDLSDLATYNYVDSTFSLKNHNHTGIYQPIMGSDDNYVTDFEKIKLSNLSGINTGDQDLSGLLTISAATNIYSPTSHTHDNIYYTKSQSDNIYVNSSGDTVNGELIALKFTKINGTANEFLMADGSSNYKKYYTESESDSRFVNVTGDTMSGKLTVSAGGISVAGVNKTGNIFTDVTGGTVLSGVNTGDQDLSGLATYNYVNSTFSPTGHTHVPEYDLRYVNVTGDTMTGSLTAASFVKQGGTASQFLKANGSVDTNTYSLSSHLHDDRYYTESESDSRFVNVTGDTMSGKLTVSDGGISVAGVNRTGNIFTDTTGGTVLSGVNTGDQDLSGLATYDYVDNTFSPTTHTHIPEYDLRYVNVTGDTMTGSLTAASFVKQGGTASQFLKANGSVDSNSYSLSSHLHDDRYYTESESDSRFVNVDGDTMSGNLTISAGGISVAGVNKTGNIFTDVTGGTVLSGVNTGDQDLSGLATYTYVDGTFLKLAGGIMTGSLYVNNSTNSTSTTTGAIRTAGGLGVVGNIYAGGTVTAPTFSGALSGNASTATKLSTVRTIWGQNFDGSGNVSGNLTGVGTISANGKLTISSGGISVAGVNRVGNIFTDTTGGTVLAGVNTGDQDLSGLATYDYVNSTFSNINHKHYNLYTPDGTSEVVYSDNGGSFHVKGNLYVSGSTYSTNSETLIVSDAYIKLRDGATAGLGQNEYSGLEFINYDGINNGRLVIDNTGTARVGDVGDEQPLATRDESNNMLNGGLVYWSSNDQIFKTTFDKYLNLTGGTINGNIVSTSFIKSGYTDDYILLAGGGIINKAEFQVSLGPDQNYVTDSEKIKLSNLSGINTGDQDLSGLATYDYVNSTFLKLAGGTMTGSFYVNNSTNSTSTTTGSIRTAGGLGVVGNGYFGGTVTAPTFSGALSGNATTATQLQNTRTIWGQNFDGSGNVSGNLTGVGTISANGRLTISAGGISVAGVNRTGNIFTDTTGGTVLSGVNTGDQDLSELATYDYVDGTFSPTTHTHIPEYDLRYVNVTGDTMTGSLTATSFVKQGGTASQFLKANGSIDSNTYSLSSHLHDDRYYTESESDSRFVNVDGDTMSGKLTVSSGGISVAGVNKTGNIFTDVTGGTVLSGVNTGDQDLSGLATYNYVDNTFSPTTHTHIPEYDLRYVNVTGDTMTGSLTATSFVKQDGTASQFLKANGSVDSNSYSLSSHLHDDRYYTESESDSRFVNVAGDTMSDKLTISAGGISVAGVNRTGNIFTDVTGGTVLSGVNTGDQDLSGLATYTYVDGTFLKLVGGTMTGAVYVNNSTNSTSTTTGAIRTAGGLGVVGNGYFGGTVTAPTFSGSLSGNASTATKLATVRTLWGQNFDGSGNVSGNLTGVGTISASGKLTISAGGISVAGVNKTGNIFTDTTGGTVLSGVNTGDQDLSGLATYTYVDNTFSLTGHTHIPEYDLRYVNVTGDTMTGSLTATSFVKQGGTDSQFLKANGSVDSNSYSLSSHLHDDRYYTESESDSRFVNATGDTMSGKLTVSAGGISVAGVNRSGNIFTDVTGGTVLSGVNTGDQDLSGLATYTYVDNTFLKLAGGTMTGSLYVNNSTNSTSTTTGAIRTAGGLGVVGNGYFGGTVTAPTFSGALNGNATTATKLATVRTIWGQNFDGSGNVSGALTGVSTISASGKLTISAGGISVAGVNRTGNIFTDVTGGTVLAGVNTGDQDLSELATYDYVDGTFLKLAGGTINGQITISESNTGQTSLIVNGNILQNSLNISNVSTSSLIYLIPKTICDSAFIDYRVFNTTTRAMRAGTLIVIWDSVNNVITYTDTSSQDLTSTTNSFKLYSTINGNNVQIMSTITSGNWNIKMAVRLL